MATGLLGTAVIRPSSINLQEREMNPLASTLILWAVPPPPATTTVKFPSVYLFLLVALIGALICTVWFAPATDRVKRVIQYLLATLSFATVICKTVFIVTPNDRSSWILDFATTAATWGVIVVILKREEQQDRHRAKPALATADLSLCSFANQIAIAKQDIIGGMEEFYREQQYHWLVELGTALTLAVRSSRSAVQQVHSMARLAALNDLHHSIYIELCHLGNGEKREPENILNALHAQAVRGGVEGDLWLALEAAVPRLSQERGQRSLRKRGIRYTRRNR
jgi:hypothetical protein